MNHYDQEKCSSVKMYPVFGKTYYHIVKYMLLAGSFSTSSVHVYQIKRYQIPEECNVHGYSSDNLRLNS